MLVKRRLFCLATVVVSTGLLIGALRGSSAPATANDSMSRFASMSPIDAHIHVFEQTPALKTFLSRYNLHLLDILVVDNRDPFYKDFQSQLQKANSVLRANPGRAALCTTFDPYDFEKPDFAQRAIRQLNERLRSGSRRGKDLQNDRHADPKEEWRLPDV